MQQPKATLVKGAKKLHKTSILLTCATSWMCGCGSLVPTCRQVPAACHSLPVPSASTPSQHCTHLHLPAPPAGPPPPPQRVCAAPPACWQPQLHLPQHQSRLHCWVTDRQHCQDSTHPLSHQQAAAGGWGELTPCRIRLEAAACLTPLLLLLLVVPAAAAAAAGPAGVQTGMP
jgi:hypothetical protein